jgi:hypothetical protein
MSSNKAKYTTRDESLLSLGIPLDKMTNKEEYAEYEIRQRQLRDSGQKPYVIAPPCRLRGTFEPAVTYSRFNTATRTRRL